jgi:hypothetical protein
MEPVPPESLTDDDTEFDLDVRVRAVAGEHWAERGETPHTAQPGCTHITCVTCHCG